MFFKKRRRYEKLFLLTCPYLIWPPLSADLSSLSERQEEWLRLSRVMIYTKHCQNRYLKYVSSTK